MTEFDYRRVLETLSHAVIATDPTHRIVFANRAVEPLLGWDADSLIGRVLAEVLPRPIHPNDYGQPVTTQGIAADGRPRDLEVVMTVSPSHDSQVFVATLRPASGPGRWEAEARRLRTLIDSVSVGVVLAESVDAPISVVNKSAETIVGESHDFPSYMEFASRFPVERLDGRQVEWKDRPMAKALVQGEAFKESFRFRRKDGRELVLEVAATPFAGQKGAVVITFADVTERHRQEQESADRAAQFRALLDHLPVGVAYFDKMAVCRAGNGPARRFLGRSRTEITGAPADELFLGNPVLRDALHRCVQDHRPHAEAGVAWPDLARPGTIRYLDWKFEPLGIDPAKPRGALALIVDVTESTRAKSELQRAKEEAEGASRRKTQFLSAVSHDLRTPVNALSLQAELLGHMVGDREDPGGELRGLAADIRTVSANLIELINDLLDLTRFDSGRIDYQVQEFALDDWLESTLSPLNLSARSKGLTLSWTNDLTGRIMRGDRVKIGRVLMNLVGNAIKFTEQGGVFVSVRTDAAGWVRLEVRDTGAGIPPDQRERIFDEFAQLRNPERDRNKGTGLGLAICRRLVEGVGGRLSVESQAGKGSIFTALYPPDHLTNNQKEPAAPSEGRPIPRLANAGAATILLVEDDANSLNALARLLRHAGYNTITASSGLEALEMIPSRKPDIVLLDLMLPGLDGVEVLRRIKADAHASGIKVIVLTGDVASKRSEQVREFGADGLLAKPVDFDALKSMLIASLPAVHTEAVRTG